jgi:hypothetical protein
MGDFTDAALRDDAEADPLEAGLRAAFGPDSTSGGAEVESVLAKLAIDCGVSSRLLLREGPDDPSETISSGASGAGRVQRGIGRYVVAGEIARGGVGVVLKGRDADLGREVAIKTLRAEHAGKPAMIRRLVEEAQIGGQLQHPGVLPVYEMGMDAARQPFFTMKLVKGETLARLLADRSDPSRERRRFLTVFEQVCQTMAYAHARGVVHRDLKPANIMVGSFGEVQVVDWGLAKVLDRRGAFDEATVATVRDGPAGTQSEVGSVLGTPAYMAPEQARGEVDGLDERCDVFALGAILCEVLTSRPPFEGPRAEVIRQAAEGRLDEAFARLGVSGADAELVRLAQTCLSADRVDRPKDAGLVARQVSAYLASAEERVRRAEMDAALARARALAERRARRVIVVAGVLTLSAMLIGGGSYLRAERQRVEVERQRVEIERERVEVERQRVVRLQKTLTLFASIETKGLWLLGQAESATGPDAARWADALALTAQAIRQTLALETDETTRKRALSRLKRLEATEATLRARAGR